MCEWQNKQCKAGPPECYDLNLTGEGKSRLSWWHPDPTPVPCYPFPDRPTRGRSLRRQSMHALSAWGQVGTSLWGIQGREEIEED